MKLKQNQASTHQQTSEYVHPWYQYLNKPKPPTQQAVEKAKFVDKTYQWSGNNSVRPGDKRVTK
jgi:hypothetical protein|tara:strand:+ start:105 stop:296 length:192 start_codon:yes stop_codon:yes gene_type:complete